jgi:hypothetical protein
MMFQHQLFQAMHRTYGSTAPFGFGALYQSAYLGEVPEDPMDFFRMFLPDTQNERVAMATWAAPIVAGKITPGALSLVPPAAVGGVVAAAATATWIDLIGDAIAGAASNIFSGYQSHRM